jgi:hypothetical protein
LRREVTEAEAGHDDQVIWGCGADRRRQLRQPAEVVVVLGHAELGDGAFTHRGGAVEVVAVMATVGERTAVVAPAGEQL